MFQKICETFFSSRLSPQPFWTVRPVGAFLRQQDLKLSSYNQILPCSLIPVRSVPWMFVSCASSHRRRCVQVRVSTGRRFQAAIKVLLRSPRGDITKEETRFPGIKRSLATREAIHGPSNPAAISEFPPDRRKVHRSLPTTHLSALSLQPFELNLRESVGLKLCFLQNVQGSVLKMLLWHFVALISFPPSWCRITYLMPLA